MENGYSSINDPYIAYRSVEDFRVSIVELGDCAARKFVFLYFGDQEYKLLTPNK